MLYGISGYSTGQVRAKPTAPATGGDGVFFSRQLLEVDKVDEVDEKTLDTTRPIPLKGVLDTLALSHQVDEAWLCFLSIHMSGTEA